jgi:hypothetical protein
MSNNFYPHKTVNGVKKTVHRHVMEESLGRELEPDEHVYHINGDSRDNRLENLVLIKKTYNKPPKPRKKKVENVQNMLLGVNTTNEIFNLWYEITFLRHLLSHILQQNPEVGSCLSDEAIQKCRKEAQDCVQDRFPVCKIEFSMPTEEQIKKRKEHMESLKNFNRLMGGIAGPVVNEDRKEGPVCSHPTLEVVDHDV